MKESDSEHYREATLAGSLRLDKYPKSHLALYCENAIFRHSLLPSQRPSIVDMIEDATGVINIMSDQFNL